MRSESSTEKIAPVSGASLIQCDSSFADELQILTDRVHAQSRATNSAHRIGTCGSSNHLPNRLRLIAVLMDCCPQPLGVNPNAWYVAARLSDGVPRC